MLAWLFFGCSRLCVHIHVYSCVFMFILPFLFKYYPVLIRVFEGKNLPTVFNAWSYFLLPAWTLHILFLSCGDHYCTFISFSPTGARIQGKI